MHSVGYFLVLAQQVAFGMAYFWPITLLLAVGWVWAFVATKPQPNRGRWWFLTLGCLPPFVLPVAILVCGVVFVSEPPWVAGGEAPTFPGYLIDALLLVHLPLAGLATWWWRGQRPAVAASWVCAWYVSLGAGLVSTMSVTGVWL